MPEQEAQATGEDRETVSFTLPPRMVRAIAIYAARFGFKAKSRAAEDLIARGLATVEKEKAA